MGEEDRQRLDHEHNLMARRRKIENMEENCDNHDCHLDAWEMRLDIDEEECHKWNNDCHWIQEDRQRIEHERNMPHDEREEEPQMPTEEDLQKFADATGAPYENIAALTDDVMAHMAAHGYPGDDGMMQVVMDLAPAHDITSTAIEKGFAHMAEDSNHN